MEGDLAFNEGDTVWVYWGQDNGWWFGSAGGLQGWFPESYVEVTTACSFIKAWILFVWHRITENFDFATKLIYN